MSVHLRNLERRPRTRQRKIRINTRKAACVSGHSRDTGDPAAHNHQDCQFSLEQI